MQGGYHPRVPEPALDNAELMRPVISFGNAAAASAVEDETARAYDEFAHRLRPFAAGATHDRALADDVVHDAFLRLVVELQAGRRPANLGGWLYRVAANLIVSRGRRTVTAERARAHLVRRDVEPSPEHDVLAHERDRTLALALSRLPASARIAVLLAARGMGSTEIGIVIRKSPGATRTYLFRARAKLRDEFATLAYAGDR